MAARVAAFRKGLQDLGWVPGTNLQVDARFGSNDDDLREKAKELIGLAPNVILAMAPPSVIALQKINRSLGVGIGALVGIVGWFLK